MDFHAYLTKHDGKPRSDGPELLRLAAACKKNPYYFYLLALGHKRVSTDTAQTMHANSIGLALDPTRINRAIKEKR